MDVCPDVLTGKTILAIPIVFLFHTFVLILFLYHLFVGLRLVTRIFQMEVSFFFFGILMPWWVHEINGLVPES